MKIDTRYTQDRELSWLRFNRRVLEEAEDETVPLMERLKFTAIFTSNLDEFFMVRVGSLTDLALAKKQPLDSRTGKTPQEQLTDIFKAVHPLYKQRDRIYGLLERRLRSCNVCRLSMDELSGKERRRVEAWFQNELRPILSPLVLGPRHPFPHLDNKRLTLAFSLRGAGPEQEEAVGLLPFPAGAPPYLMLEGSGLRFLLLEDVLMEFAPQLFQPFSVVGRAVVAVTRNADISPEDEAYEVDEDFRQHMQKVVRKRARLAPVRLEVQSFQHGDRLAELLCRKLELSPEQVFRSRAPLSLQYVYALADRLPPESAAVLCDPPAVPRDPVCLDCAQPILPQVLRHDALLFYPYESMEPFLRLVREAAFDPQVVSIKITIYRLAARAKLAEYLAAAAENGKDVTVLMELRARFDEQNNIQWAERLEEAGCTLLYGTENRKVHSKICLITRRSRNEMQQITQIGTGNYNEKTAKLYTDLCLITADPTIGSDAAAFFQNMAVGRLNGSYRQLLASPVHLRERVLALIDREIAKGPDGYLFFKLNSITDRVLIDKLAQASQAGVEIVLNVRGICCILPGVPGLTDHLSVFSIVGRFLEHARIYQFGRGSDADLYLSSADFMTRNTLRRVEIACPVLDPWARARLLHIIQVMQQDTAKARIMDSAGAYHRRAPEGQPVNSQEVFLCEPVVPPAWRLEPAAKKPRWLGDLVRRIRLAPAKRASAL